MLFLFIYYFFLNVLLFYIGLLALTSLFLTNRKSIMHCYHGWNNYCVLYKLKRSQKKLQHYEKNVVKAYCNVISLTLQSCQEYNKLCRGFIILFMRKKNYFNVLTTNNHTIYNPQRTNLLSSQTRGSICQIEP